MTANERRQRGTVLCAQLTREVAAIAPVGIGEWERAWVITAPADATFMFTLVEWEQSGDEALKKPLRKAYLNVLNAWRLAAEEFQGEVA